jgi:hypothetical protein
MFQPHTMACRPPCGPACSREWARLLAAGGEELFASLLRLYPERVNPYTVWLSERRLLDGA